MRTLTAAMMTLIALAGCNRAAPAAAARPDGSPLLRRVQVIELPGVEGRFDHFAADAKGGRLYRVKARKVSVSSAP